MSALSGNNMRVTNNRRLARLCMLLGVALLVAMPASAHWQELDFDLTKKDAAAYVTDLPDSAFTPQGLQLKLKPNTTYKLNGKRLFSGDFSYELQIDVPDRSEKGVLNIDVLLTNDEKNRKVVGTYFNSSAKPATDRCTIQYFKDGKAAGFQWDKSWCDTSTSTGHSGNMEWLRIHKAGAKVWFMQKMKQHAYQWPTMANYPLTNYFKEDCESFKLGFVIRTSPEFTGTLNIKTMRIWGTAVKPRDLTKRTFLFDFGPVNQELEDDFMPVSDYTRYTKENGFGWIIPEEEKVVHEAEGIAGLTDEEIAKEGFAPIPKGVEGWYAAFVRQCYWLQFHDKKVLYSVAHGGDFIEFFKQYLDLKTPLERDCVGMGRPYQFAFNELYQKDIEERRGSMYIDDDLSGEFAVDLPNGRYNLIVGVGYTGSWFGGGSEYNLEIEGRVRKMGLGPNWRRPMQHTIRDVQVEDGQMNLRFFCDVRKAMDPYANHSLGTGWMINYIVILPAEDRDALNEWEWKIIKRRGEIIRRVTFVEGDPAVVALQDNFITLNGKPFFFLKVMNSFVPGDTDHNAYYSVANVMSGAHDIRNSQHFFKPDWEKLSYSDDYPWDTIDRMNCTYTWHALSSFFNGTILSFVPHAVTGEGNPTVDSRGRQNRYNIQPPLNSALGKEIQKEAYTMMANQLREHPANAGHFIYEELWHPDEAGYDEQSLLQYWDWLKNQYKTIEALNAKWGRQYKSFDEVQPPKQEGVEFWEYSPEWVNFRIFRGWAQREMVKSACELVRTLEPGHFTWAAKGDYGTQSWHTGEFLDMFGWYSPYVAASVARYYNKAAVSCGYLLHCEDAYLDGRRQFDHKPGPKQYLGHEDASFYNRIVSSVFKGSKGFFNEWYCDGMQHLFHRTDMIKEQGPKFQIKHWTGQICFFEDNAYKGPPVKMNPNGLAVQAANQMLYRLGHLWMPARPMEPKVLFPVTEPSCFLTFFAERPYADFEEVSMRVIRSSNLPADFINLPFVKDLSKYQLIVLADIATAIPKADAQRIRKFVADGGKLILVNAAGFSDDLKPRRYNKKPGEVFPLEEFADLGGYRIEADSPWHMPMGKMQVSWVKNDVMPELADGQSLGEWDTNFYYTLAPGSGSTVFLKGFVPKFKKDVVVGLVNKERNVIVIAMPPKTAPDEVVRPISKFCHKLIDTWKIDGRVVAQGVDDAWNLYTGYLQGDGYRLVAACNWDEVNPATFNLRVTDLPAGDYAVIDVTGQRPDLGLKPDGGQTLAPPPAEVRQSKIMATLSAQQLSQQGVACQIKPRQAQVFLLRPMRDNVWVSIYPGALGEFSRRGVSVAYGTGPSDKAGADKIVAAIVAKGFKAQAVPAGEVKKTKLHHEVRIKPNGINREYHEDMSKWYLMDTFDNEVVDTDLSLIVVGSEETNPLLKHLDTDKTFVYDKAGEKITAAYPGPGRGVIGWIDSVNSAVYDVRSQCRDAVVVGGSDAAGTTVACEKLADLIAKHAVVKVLPTPPKIGGLTTKPASTTSSPAK